MANIADTKQITIADNEGKVGANNQVDVTGKSSLIYTFLSGCLNSLIEYLFFLQEVLEKMLLLETPSMLKLE